MCWFPHGPTSAVAVDRQIDSIDSKKSTSGMGSIRKITRGINGKTYTYYEARYTAGFDPGTGKQIQRSITGKTQKEVSQKLKAALAALDSGTYIAPCKMTVAEWLDSQYLGGVMPPTMRLSVPTSNPVWEQSEWRPISRVFWSYKGKCKGKIKTVSRFL